MRKIKFQQSHKFNWYILLWILSVILIWILFDNWHFDKQYIGIVEKRSHQLSTRESGIIDQLFVSVGDSVNQNQILAKLDISDLESHLNQLKSELLSIESMDNARQQRYALEIQTMGLRLENEASNLLERLSIIESKSTELAGLNEEIKRLQKAEKAGLGYSRDMADLIVQRDALTSYLRELNKDLERQTQKVNQSRKSQAILEYANLDSLSKSMYTEELEHAARLRREIGLTENRITLRTLTSPCNGYVTELLAQHGDVVQQFIPVLTIEESNPQYMTVFIPEKSRLQPEPGMQVKIKSLRKETYNTTGEVAFIHPGLSQVTERLTFRGQLFWARKVHVCLTKDHQLIPGEMVHVRILKKKNRHKVIPKSDSQKRPSTPLSQFQEISLPQKLQHQTRFEPSGICYLSESDRFLIASDDTGIQDASNDHCPCLFLMDRKGQIDAAPVHLTELDTFNDIEAITPANNGIIYLISSQNISMRGKRPKSREQIIQLKVSNDQFHVTGKIHLLSLLLNHFTTTELKNLGLTHYEADRKPVINIEAAAYLNGDLYLGLKEPVTQNGALLWKISDIASLFKLNSLKHNQLSIAGYIDFKNGSGFSDMVFDHQGTLWACSTIPDISLEAQSGGFFKLVQNSEGTYQAQRIHTFPGMKPEGICIHEKQFTLIFDCDDAIPSFINIAIEP